MVAHAIESRSSQPAWLALAVDGPALQLPDLAGGATVSVVPDVPTFLELLVSGRPRVALLGAPPAGTRDVELVARERRRRHGLRVVQLTEPEAVATRLHALRLGFDEALSTSIAASELAARVALLDERARARPDRSIVVADGCVLDLAAHELRRHGRVVHLRPKEFELLAVLAAHPGRAHTRRQLLDRA